MGRTERVSEGDAAVKNRRDPVRRPPVGTHPGVAAPHGHPPTEDRGNPKTKGAFFRRATAARDAGILVHGVGAGGAYGWHWLVSIQVQHISDQLQPDHRRVARGRVQRRVRRSHNGYLPTPEHHKLGGYETWRAKSSYLEVDASPKIVAELRALLTTP